MGEGELETSEHGSALTVAILGASDEDAVLSELLMRAMEKSSARL